MLAPLMIVAAVAVTPAATDPLEAAIDYTDTVADLVTEQEHLAALAAERAAAAEQVDRSTRTPISTVLNWAALRECEAGGNYATDTGNGYYGAYQFDLGTWASYGPPGNPALASPQEQDARAQALYNSRGASPWPVCGALL